MNKKWLGMTSIVLSMSLIAAGCGAENGSATQTPAGSPKHWGEGETD